jgi:hypothetical protein
MCVEHSCSTRGGNHLFLLELVARMSGAVPLFDDDASDSGFVGAAAPPQDEGAGSGGLRVNAKFATWFDKEGERRVQQQRAAGAALSEAQVRALLKVVKKTCTFESLKLLRKKKQLAAPAGEAGKEAAAAAAGDGGDATKLKRMDAIIAALKTRVTAGAALSYILRKQSMPVQAAGHALLVGGEPLDGDAAALAAVQRVANHQQVRAAVHAAAQQLKKATYIAKQAQGAKAARVNTGTVPVATGLRRLALPADETKTKAVARGQGRDAKAASAAEDDTVSMHGSGCDTDDSGSVFRDEGPAGRVGHAGAGREHLAAATAAGSRTEADRVGQARVAVPPACGQAAAAVATGSVREASALLANEAVTLPGAKAGVAAGGKRHGRGAGKGRGLTYLGEPAFDDLHPAWRAKRQLARREAKVMTKALRRGPEAAAEVIVVADAMRPGPEGERHT